MGTQRKCCCTCAEMFAGIAEGDEVNVDVVAGPGGSRTISGTLVDFEENTVIIDEGPGNVGRVRVCCAHIVSVYPIPE